MRKARNRRARKGAEMMPLYTVEQARVSLGRLRAVPYETDFRPGPGVSCRFREAGHILGSAVIEIDVGEGARARRLVVSGDIGQPLRPLLRDPAYVERADVLCVESTYGNRAHRALDATLAELVGAIRHTLIERGGNVIIPSFAVGRTQEILFVLCDLVRCGRLDPLKVVIDSPMASAVTALTLRHRELWDDETRALHAWSEANPGRFDVRFVQDLEESMALNEVRGGLVIISASGMCDAGRIRHHLRHNLGRSECAILIVGFQAAGTLGRRLVDGARQVTLFGERVPVRAKIHTIGGLSAHADQPALLDWMAHFKQAPKHTFVVHGEPLGAQALADAIHQRLGWTQPIVPEPGLGYEIP